MDGATGGVILAAGSGSRFGGRKLLAAIDGRPMLQAVLDLARGLRLRPLIVVLGSDGAEIAGLVNPRSARIVHNPSWREGLSTSVRHGLAELEVSAADRALVLLGDQPFLGVDQAGAILAAPRDEARPIVVPRYGGVPGTPVLLERKAWPLAAALSGDRGMAQLFGARPSLVRYLDVPGTNPDIDTAGDLAALSRGAG